MGKEGELPLKECDLVLEGGLVSGLVHPAAILELAKTYCFRSVGGASAGAYVAAATAAAERARDHQGFERLAEFAAELRRPGLVDQLFQAPPRTAPLLRVVLAAMRAANELPARAGAARTFRVLRALLGATRRDVTMGAAIGLFALAIVVVLVHGAVGPLALLPAAVFAALGGLAAALRRLVVILIGLRDAGFGIVSGLHEPGRPEALTEWLARWLDRIAEVPGPLTLGDLGSRLSLHTITTNLSELRPYAVPFRDHRFIFNETDMRGLFPDSVVAHLIARAYESDRVVLPPGYHFLPEWTDLPVIVLVRLSNSFPLLLRAIPLYTIDAGATAPEGQPVRPRPGQLCPNWFSDGGICSNFPIHFFDSWIPRRPTFGISIMDAPQRRFHNLADVEVRTAEAPNLQGAVHLPTPDRAEPAGWRAIDTVAGFLGAALSAAKDHRDTLQRELPGYRERVVQVRLANESAGLGAAMDPTALAGLGDLGRQAGSLLREFDFEQHRWVRLRSLVPRLAVEAARVGQRIAAGFTVAAVERAVKDRSETTGGPPLYPVPDDWSAHAQQLLLSLAEAGAPLSGADAPRAPRPAAALRLTPQVGGPAPSAERHRQATPGSAAP
jgi:predicted acylesterase/phospholipase RssA